jgi:Fe-S cluster assembly protein SufD
MSLTTTDKNINTLVLNSLQPKSAGNKDAIRLEAFEYLQNTGLPGTRHEEYKHTPLARELEKNFSFTGNTGSLNAEVDVKQFTIPGLEANVLVFVNGKFSKEHSQIISPAADLSVVELSGVTDGKNEVAGAHFGQYASFKNDGFAAWNTAGWTGGLFIHVQDNIVLDRPIIIHHIHDASASEIISINRNLIVAGKNSQVTVIEKFDSVGQANHLLNLVAEIVVEENAGLNFYSIHNDEGNRYQYSLTEIQQKRSSRVNTYSFTLNGRLIRNNLQLVLDGEGIESHMYGLYLLRENTMADNHTVVDHRKPNSFSNELYKGVMDDRSKGIFNGKIYVRPQAQKTNAFQANRNILLTDKASVNTKPQLEIWADDVKCSHGCTSGQLDDEALFYLRTRGINKETAQAMMLYAFAAEVIGHISDPLLRNFLDGVISERLHKNF